MTQETVEQFLNLNHQIEKTANRRLARYMELRKEITEKPVTSCLSFLRVSVAGLEFSGDEYWKFGGHEHHELVLPVSYLYDPDWEVKVAQGFFQEVEQQHFAIVAAQEKIQQEELATLDKLSKKYPNTVGA